MNPIYGSVGLLWSGSWHLCQAAVEAVLKGAPITPITSEAAVSSHGPPLKAYDIRHVSKDENSAASNDPTQTQTQTQKVTKTRCRFKRTVVKPKARKAAGFELETRCDSPAVTQSKWAGYCAEEMNRSTSHDSSVSHQSDVAPNVDGESKETETSMVSVETAEASPLFRAEPESAAKPENEPARDNELALELTLGLDPAPHARHVVPVKKRRIEASGSGGSVTSDDGACKIELGLEYPA